MGVTTAVIAPEHYVTPTGSSQIPIFKYKAEISDFHGNGIKWSTDSTSPADAKLISLSITLARGANPDTGSVTIDNTDFSCANKFKMGDRIKIWLGFDTNTFGDSNYIFGGYIQKIEPNLNQDIKLTLVDWSAILNTCSLPRVSAEYSGQTPESIICAIYGISGLGGSCNTEATGLTFKKETFKKHLVGTAIRSIYSKTESWKGAGRENEVECLAWDPDAVGCGSCGGAVQADGKCGSCGSTNNTCNNSQNSACNNPCASGGTGSNCGSCGTNCASCAGSCNGSCPINSGGDTSGGGISSGSGGTSGTSGSTGGQSGGCGGTEEGSEDITGTKTFVHWDLWMDENNNLYFKPVKDSSSGCLPIYSYGDNLMGAKGLFNEIDCYNSVDCKACVGEGVKWEGLEVPLDPSLNLYDNNTVHIKTPMNDSKARIDKISYSLSGAMSIDVVKLGSEAGATDLPKDTGGGSCSDSSCGGGCGS